MFGSGLFLLRDLEWQPVTAYNILCRSRDGGHGQVAPVYSGTVEGPTARTEFAKVQVAPNGATVFSAGPGCPGASAVGEPAGPRASGLAGGESDLWTAASFAWVMSVEPYRRGIRMKNRAANGRLVSSGATRRWPLDNGIR